MYNIEFSTKDLRIPHVHKNFLHGVLEYINGKFFVRHRNVIYKINSEDFSLEGCNILYSLPNNDKYLPWTTKHSDAPYKLRDLKIVSKYWSKYKPGIKVRGRVDNDEVFRIL
jgi:hypothetical protein